MQIESQEKFSLVIGLGQTGLSYIRYLQRLKKNIRVIDTRLDAKLFTNFSQTHPYISYCFGKCNTAWCIDAEEILLSPGVSLQQLGLNNNTKLKEKITGDLNIFAKKNTKPFAAVTGTNGKTTVVTLVNNMLKEAKIESQAIGNIGVPVLDMLVSGNDKYVVECSSYQLETTKKLSADVACFLNLSPDHLDRYQNMQAYLLAKQRIYCGARVAIYNRQDHHTKPTYQVGKLISFGLDEPTTVNDWGVRVLGNAKYLCCGQNNFLAVQKLRMQSSKDIANFLAAGAIAHSMGVDLISIAAVITAFENIAHRYTHVLTQKQICWINDSKATNMHATIAALQAVEKKYNTNTILILGGDAKGASLSELVPEVVAKCSLVILLGLDKYKLEKLFQSKLPVYLVNDMAQAVALAYKKAKPNSLVLLSPACASTDMYANYQQRGNEFTKLVKERLFTT